MEMKVLNKRFFGIIFLLGILLILITVSSCLSFIPRRVNLENFHGTWSGNDGRHLIIFSENEIKEIILNDNNIACWTSVPIVSKKNFREKPYHDNRTRNNELRKIYTEGISQFTLGQNELALDGSSVFSRNINFFLSKDKQSIAVAYGTRVGDVFTKISDTATVDVNQIPFATLHLFTPRLSNVYVLVTNVDYISLVLNPSRILFLSEGNHRVSIGYYRTSSDSGSHTLTQFPFRAGEHYIAESRGVVFVFRFLNDQDYIQMW